MAYTREQALKLWSSVKYNESRYWAFMKRQHNKDVWVHTDSVSCNRTFKNFEDFYGFIRGVNAKDVHVKKTVNGGREWVIDVDHEDKDSEKIRLKNMISHLTFASFFGENCIKIMYSGNRGLHVWLASTPTKFSIDAPISLRKYYYDNVLKAPTKINPKLTKPGSMAYAFVQALENDWVKRKITELYPNIKLQNYNQLIKEFYPRVDQQVFCSLKQIRAPYSYHSKSDKYSCDHVLLGIDDK